MPSISNPQYFKEIVENIFSRWTALKLCVEHGMGGKNGHQVNSAHILPVIVIIIGLIY